ncbi:MAG: M48 family metallopeptidase [Bacteroidota bacterium]
MTKKLIFISLLMLWLLNCIAQDVDLNNFKYLQSSGNIPEDFTSLFSKKFEQDKGMISKEDKRSVRKSKEKFLMESNFYIDQILLSGRILFNDPVSQYINRVADTLLQANPSLRKELRFYVAKSPSVNAFSTDKGIIMVNLGLIAQLENEAQLAYVLAHEIIHYVKKHNMNLFLEKNNIFKGQDGYKKLSLSERYFATNFRNREMESEADKLGLEDIYLQSNYSLKVLDGVFDVLQYSYLPFDDAVFDTTFFESAFMHFPQSYFLKTINAIKGEEDYDETKSIHPSIKSRREIMRLSVSEKPNVNRKDFILPKEDFTKVRALARFESIHQYVILRDYGNAIYNSFIMLKEYPGNKFLETAIAYSLYAISEYKIDGQSMDKIYTSYKKIEGQSQQLFFLLHSIKKDDMPAIALHYVWKVHQQYPQDEFITLLCDKSFDNLINKSKKTLSDFSRKPKEEVKIEIENSINTPDTVAKGKYDKIKKSKANQELKDDNYIKYAFVDLLKDAAFLELFTRKIDKFNEKEKIQLSDKESRLAYKKEKREERKIKKYGAALGIDTVLLIDPFYFVIDQRKKENMSFFDSENKRLDFTTKLNKNALRAGLNIEILNPKTLKADDVQQFNDLGRMNDWIEERFNHEDVELLPYETSNSKKVLEKFNTKHIAWTGVVSMRKKKPMALYIIASVIMPLYLPYTLPMMIAPSYDTYFYYILFNSETGKSELQLSLQANTKDRSDFLNSWMYYTMFQIKNSRK